MNKAGINLTTREKRNKYLLAKYGITVDIYDKMFLHGKKKCWICERPPKPGKNLNVDHEHLTKAQRKAGLIFGRVRGLLCFFCNKYMVGRRKTQHAVLFYNAWKYLSNKKDWRINAIQES